MAESKQGTSASGNPKEKKSLLDDEIGQDFLSSWKSMSVTQDDMIDFNFDTVPKGKKKTFNFEKLDMDFNLDADFDKLSSFKVDMPDLDFPCPSKKTAKPKERTEDSYSGNCQEKKDHFGFSFDFNDEDFANDAQFGSKLMGSSKSLTRELTNSGPVLLRSEENVKDLSNIREDFDSDGVQNGSKVVGNLRPLDEQGLQGEPNILSREENAGEDLHNNDVQIGSQLRGNSMSPTTEITDSETGSLISENNVKNFSDIREGFNSDGVQNGTQLVGDLRSLNKQVIQDEPDMLRSENNSDGEDLHANDAQIGNQWVNTSKSISSDLTEGEPILLRSENTVKNLSNIREVFESDGEQNGSKLVSNVKLQDKQAAKGQSVMPGSENNTGEGFNTNDAQVGKKLVLKSLSRELTKTEPVLEESKNNNKYLSNISKIGGNSWLQEKEATSGKPVQLRSDKSSIFQVNLSRSTEKIAKPDTQASGNPKYMISSMESIRNLKNHSAEGNKIGKRAPELSSLKILRTVGASRDIPNSTVLRQNNSLRNLEQNTKLAENATSKLAHPVGDTDKQKPLTPSLKRKISEYANLVSLKPLKRLSESPKESRSCKESSGRVVEEETCNNENQAQSKTKYDLHDQPTSRLEVSQEVKMTELEISLVMENDENVEKAEAYTKELEYICSMLKKKHEEAKEVLVRAIVNNNNLLMLNHPIYEEKIRIVQNFATQLTLKEIPIDH